MAQWGRTTDIEWIYRVEVDAQGRRVPGTGVFQSPNHGTTMFHGRYDGTHPLLQTCTSNNNVCDAKALKAQHQAADPMRFALSTRDVLGAAQPREHEMDINPWTYQVMAREMVREHKIESPLPTRRALALGDQRTYLYLAVDPRHRPSGLGRRGRARRGRRPARATRRRRTRRTTATRSSTIDRDGPAATTVELPAGTTPADIASDLRPPRARVGTDNGATLHVTDVHRAFFLGSTYLPRAVVRRTARHVTLDPATPTQSIWPAGPDRSLARQVNDR